MKMIKLQDLAQIEISNVDKKSIEGETSVKLCNFVDVYYNWAITAEMTSQLMYATAKENQIAKFTLRKGQVAITKDSETRDDIGVATYIADDMPGVILGYHCVLITPNENLINGKYLNVIFHSPYAQKYFEANASGSGQRYTLTNEIVGEFPIPVIEIEKQKQIGDLFSNIDRKIANNRVMGKIQLIDAETLYYKPLEHPKMLIDGVLSDGLAIMAGDSKIGKSWMVLWMCLQISKGEPVWGLPTRKTDVVYLALEDREWRVQQRMQDLTDTPPDNLHFGFSCGQLGAELESQIEDVLKDYPSTGLLFIDTLQMVRDNVSAKVNAYAQDYKDLSSLKKIADNHGICIFVVHHTRKERDGGNIFNDMTGSTGIMGVADTGMILRKEDRFGDNATLCITGRDVEEKKLKMII